MTTQADSIREFVNRRYILPARNTGQRTVSVRAGDVHREMNLVQRLPAVCSALGSHKFERLFNVTRVAIDGPTNGANAIFTYELL